MQAGKRHSGSEVYVSEGVDRSSFSHVENGFQLMPMGFQPAPDFPILTASSRDV